MSAVEATLARPTYSLAPLLSEVFDTVGHQSQPFRSLATEVLVRHVDKGRRGLAICGAAAGAGVSHGHRERP